MSGQTHDEVARKFIEQFVSPLQAEVDRLTAEVERLSIYEPRLKRMEFGEGRVDAEVRITPEFRERFALTLAALLADSKAENYVETKVVDPTTGSVYAVCVQRCEKKTPHEFRRDAEALLREALSNNGPKAHTLDCGPDHPCWMCRSRALLGTEEGR